MRKKTIAILGVGRGQLGLYAAAGRLGYHTIAVSIDGDYPGFAAADEARYVDLFDVEGIQQLMKSEQIDGIATACIDIGLPAIGNVCDRLHLPGLSAEAASASTNKYLMKKRLAEAGVTTAGFEMVQSEAELADVCGKLNFPLVTKAVDLCGSEGIHIAGNREELEEAFHKTMEATGREYCIVEEYIEGYECSATSFVLEGEILFVLPTGDIRYGDHEEFPIGHYLPYEDDEEVLRRIREEMTRAIHALGLNNCAVNADIMVCGKKPYILEITGRLGANGIPELTSVHLGFDIYELIIHAAMGDVHRAKGLMEGPAPEIPCRAQMLLSERDGILRHISLEEEGGNVEQAAFFVRPGDRIRKYENPRDCLGQIVVSGDSQEQCETAMQEVIDRIAIRLEQCGEDSA